MEQSNIVSSSAMKFEDEVALCTTDEMTNGMSATLEMVEFPGAGPVVDVDGMTNGISATLEMVEFPGAGPVVDVDGEWSIPKTER